MTSEEHFNAWRQHNKNCVLLRIVSASARPIVCQWCFASRSGCHVEPTWAGCSSCCVNVHGEQPGYISWQPALLLEECLWLCRPKCRGQVQRLCCPVPLSPCEAAWYPWRCATRTRDVPRLVGNTSAWAARTLWRHIGASGS